MATGDPVTILLAHQRWSMERMLLACADLTDEQLDRPFEMGMGSLRATLTHMLGAIRGWGDLLAGREQRERLEQRGPHSVAALTALLDEIATDFEASATRHPLDETVSGTRGERTWTFMRGGVITHVTTHGVHHLAQCANMLRQLGVETPPLGVVDWILTVDSPGA